MRSIAALILSLLLSPAAFGAWGIANGGVAHGHSTGNATISFDDTGADILYVCVDRSDNVAPTAPTSSLGNTFTAGPQIDNGVNIAFYCWYKLGPISGNEVLTPSSASDIVTIAGALTNLGTGATYDSGATGNNQTITPLVALPQNFSAYTSAETGPLVIIALIEYANTAGQASGPSTTNIDSFQQASSTTRIDFGTAASGTVYNMSVGATFTAGQSLAGFFTGGAAAPVILHHGGIF